MWIIEDACHAPGGYFTDAKGEKHMAGNGKYADLAIFSFHPVKHIAAGEGGMITTNDEELYNRLLTLRTHGITKDQSMFKNSIAEVGGDPKTGKYPGWYMEMQELGYNYRLTDFQVALGQSQLERADAGMEKRLAIAAKYEAAFSNIKGIQTTYVNNPSGEKFRNGHHLYIIQVEDRLGLYNHLRSKNIFAQIHYYPIHLMPYYRAFGSKPGDMPVAEKYYAHCISLPMYPSLKAEEQEYVIDCIIKFYQ
jgi:dTDP-4-amino-4,6-dideoxygalactose transaminase